MEKKYLLASAAVLLTSFSIAAIWHFAAEREPSYLNYIPHDAAGVMIIRRIPDSLEDLKPTRLGEWLDLSEKGEPESPSNETILELLDLFRVNINEVLFCLHSLQRKENGALKPELTAFLQPRIGRSEKLTETLTGYIESRFADGMSKEVIDGILEIRGRQEGEVFYLESNPGFLAISNSEEAWKQYQALKRMSDGKVMMPPWYSRMKEDSGADICLYFKGISGWMPGFFYSIHQTGSGLADSYREF